MLGKTRNNELPRKWFTKVFGDHDPLLTRARERHGFLFRFGWPADGCERAEEVVVRDVNRERWERGMEMENGGVRIWGREGLIDVLAEEAEMVRKIDSGWISCF